MLFASHFQNRYTKYPVQPFQWPLRCRHAPHWSFWGKPEIRGKDRFSASVTIPMDALKRSLRLCSEVEGEEEVIQANILITEVATVAGFVEDEIIDGARIAKLELVRGR